MNFINSRKLETSADDIFEIRRQKFLHTTRLTCFTHVFGLTVAVTMLIFSFTNALSGQSLTLFYTKFNSLNWPFGLILFGNILIVSTFTLTGNVRIATFMFLNSHIQHLSTEFRVLGHRIDFELKKINDEDAIKEIIEDHQKLLR
jgi:7tm Odorant receptor